MDVKLPTFLIIGAMRSGTSSLNGYLRAHPEVTMSVPKETHFFDRNFERGIEWYMTHFAHATTPAVGEATPNYLYHDKAIERMADTIPDAKLIVVLRNPIDRAYSHFWHNKSRDREPLDFEAAIAAEDERILSNDESTRSTFAYVDRGRYRDQLARVLDHYPLGQLHVMLFDELEQAPQQAYAETCRYLGVDTSFRPDNLGKPINRYVEFRSTRARDFARRLPGPFAKAIGRLNAKPAEAYPPMRLDTRRQLQRIFEKANQGLEQLVQRPIPQWH